MPRQKAASASHLHAVPAQESPPASSSPPSEPPPPPPSLGPLGKLYAFVQGMIERVFLTDPGKAAETKALALVALETWNELRADIDERDDFHARLGSTIQIAGQIVIADATEGNASEPVDVARRAASIVNACIAVVTEPPEEGAGPRSAANGAGATAHP
jgi:hypothetical protein